MCLQPLPDGVSLGPAEEWPGQNAGLNLRESQVVSLIAAGRSNEEITQELYIGLNTVKTYIRTAYHKMGIDTRTKAVLWAIDHGLGGRVTIASPPTPNPEDSSTMTL